MKIFTLGVLLASFSTFAQESINIYGPGGPAPAIKENAKVFQDKFGVIINLTSGPQNKWQESALKNADLIYSGSEAMLHDMKRNFDLFKSKALYMRPVSILVRKGNPKNITGIKSLLDKDIKIMVVNGAGQTGLWEDVIGRTGKVSDIDNINSKITFYANNSAEALKKWNDDPAVDAWIIWNHWQNNIKDTSELISVEPQYRIYRPFSIAYTSSGLTKENTKKFIEYLSSNEASEIFARYGWKPSWETDR
ncbi:substrate-binding domain-containing protein [Escherichia coli]|uniref:substrate-binding domain-containing protein n=1 Tax=Escherichia coli TaxID=562 RepID=UPI00191B529C|nr:substrate-binding domain-containing protein [Escherichia coli]CAD5568929.1 intestinal colonization factor encoded by prophage CP-933O [Escherichia coli]